MERKITIRESEMPKQVSDMLYGLFLEDINFACDGGLNANVLCNNSFDGWYMKAGVVEKDCRRAPEKIVPHKEGLKFWETRGQVDVGIRKPLCATSEYARVRDEAVLKNYGYNGNDIVTGRCAISIVEGHTYQFSGFFDASEYEGEACVYVEDENGTPLTEKKYVILSAGGEEARRPDTSEGGSGEPREGGWQKHETDLDGKHTAYGCFVLEIKGVGELSLDCLSFMDADYWGANDPKWSQGKLRKDLVQVLKELHPKFLRFPGGCITEGAAPGNEYKWKNTLGPLEQRVPDYNLWALRTTAGYNQSYAVGFYEYFLLCEDLQMEPLPVTWAGTSCQFRTGVPIDADCEKYEKEVIQNVFDLIDYANGDPATSEWAKKRADAGHPKPFGLKYIGFGNENWGDHYWNGCRRIYKLIKERHPEITLVFSANPIYGIPDFHKNWKTIRTEMPDALLDEHYYRYPKWFYKKHKVYDKYPRTSAGVFAGEYACNMKLSAPNVFESALSEAAFLTGIERNADLVKLSSYAPLFSLVDGAQWEHNMINFSPREVLKTANYLVQYLYMNNVGTRILDMRGSGKRGLYYSATADGRFVYVKVVNAAKKAKRLRLDLKGILGGAGEPAKFFGAQMQYLHSEDLRAKNNLTFTGKPEYEVEIRQKKLVMDENEIDMVLPGQTLGVIRVKIK